MEDYVRILMNLKNIVLLLFTPSKFIRTAVDHSLHAKPTVPKELEESTEQSMQNSVRIMRSSLCGALQTLLIMILLACITSLIFKAASLEIVATYIIALRFLSGCFIFIGIWGKAGWDIQTCSGNTLPEQVNSCLSKYLYITGMWIMLVSYLI